VANVAASVFAEREMPLIRLYEGHYVLTENILEITVEPAREARLVVRVLQPDGMIAIHYVQPAPGYTINDLENELISHIGDSGSLLKRGAGL